MQPTKIKYQDIHDTILKISLNLLNNRPREREGGNIKSLMKLPQTEDLHSIKSPANLPSNSIRIQKSFCKYHFLTNVKVILTSLFVFSPFIFF